MDTRVLYIVAIAIAAVSGGYYYYSGNANKLDADDSRNMTYTANDINLTQTNDLGHLYIRAKVDRLEQDMQKQTSKLENLHASMYENGQVNATFSSKVANGYDDNEKVILSGDVIATRLAEQGEIVFRTDELTTYPKTKKIETTHQVDVQSPQASFVSNGLKADLENSQYEFFNIRGKYAPNS